MRGALIISVIIATLIIGILVIKDMQSGNDEEGMTKKEAVQHAEQVADELNKKLDETSKKLKHAY